MKWYELQQIGQTTLHQLQEPVNCKAYLHQASKRLKIHALFNLYNIYFNCKAASITIFYEVGK